MKEEKMNTMYYNTFRILSDARKLRNFFLLFILITYVFANVGILFAQDEEPEPSEIDPIMTHLACLICRVFYLIFYVSAAIAALVVLVAGIKWIGSGDDPAARGAAKNTIVHAIIGLIIVLIAVFLVWWLVGGITQAEMANPTDFIGGCASTCGTAEG
jgi:hypothetical protein